jgi:hypothetical protein
VTAYWEARIPLAKAHTELSIQSGASMSFLFPDTNTERFDFTQMLQNFPAEYTQNVSSARQRMCDALVSQPASQAVLEAIDGYLPYLQRLLESFDRQGPEDLEKGNKFKWRSVLSKGIRMNISGTLVEKPVVGNASLYFEAINVLLAYGYTLANMANRKIGPSFDTAAEGSLAEAADSLCKAAGVFRFAALTWSTRWNKRKNVPPECSLEILQLLSELMLVDANRAALAKAEKRGMSAATLMKLRVEVSNGYEKCSQMLSKANRADLEELANPFKSYVEDGFRFEEASLLKRFAIQNHEQDQNGIAVACMTHAYNQLLKCSRAEWLPLKKAACDELAEVDELRGKYVRINNNVTYQKVPEFNDVKGSLPIGRPIAELKGFVLPPACDVPKTLTTTVDKPE